MGRTLTLAPVTRTSPSMAPTAQAKPVPETTRLLRDLAYVLHLTERVKMGMSPVKG